MFINVITELISEITINLLFYFEKTKSDSEKFKIPVSELTSNIRLAITKNLRNFPKNFKNT